MQVAEGSRSYVLHILRSSLSVVQAAGSNASASAAYVELQLDLDASRGVSHSYLLCILLLRCSLCLVQAAGRRIHICAYVKTQVYLDASHGNISLVSISLQGDVKLRCPVPVGL